MLSKIDKRTCACGYKSTDWRDKKKHREQSADPRCAIKGRPGTKRKDGLQTAAEIERKTAQTKVITAKLAAIRKRQKKLRRSTPQAIAAKKALLKLKRERFWQRQNEIHIPWLGKVLGRD